LLCCMPCYCSSIGGRAVGVWKMSIVVPVFGSTC
jgi:hypothetical protein